jgi:hypothetical protein
VKEGGGRARDVVAGFPRPPALTRPPCPPAEGIVYGTEEPMSDDKSFFIEQYFKQWNKDVNRAEALLKSEEYFLEGLLVLSCYIGALARLRYPNITEDWKSYKKIVHEYSSLNNIFDNIDLLFFYQWRVSIVGDDKEYNKLKNYDELLAIFRSEFGDEQNIKGSEVRYQKRSQLIELIKSKNVSWFDEDNFIKYIELFSNNQICYRFIRCEAVHNAYFPLLNASCQPETKKQTYRDNHQVNREVILNTVRNILERLRQESLSSSHPESRDFMLVF